MKRIVLTVTFLLVYKMFFGQGHPNVLIGLNEPSYGVKIKANWPNGNHGWARGFCISNEDTSKNFISFGAMGGVKGGKSMFEYGWIGQNWNKTFMAFRPNGNVGIGTITPTTKLDVNGRITGDAISLKGYNSISSVNGFYNKIEFTGGSHGALVFHPGQKDELMFGLHSGSKFYWGTGRSATKPNYYSMYLDGNTGDLGIKGKFTSNEVLVKVGGWADFVFHKDYNLPSLAQVEKHIQEKGHLSDIPSAKEVAENGVKLGEMNKKLLQKIEELTLYTIAQEKRLKTQDERHKKEEERNRRQESRLEKQDKENEELLSLVKALSKRIEKLEKN